MHTIISNICIFMYVYIHVYSCMSCFLSHTDKLSSPDGVRASTDTSLPTDSLTVSPPSLSSYLEPLSDDQLKLCLVPTRVLSKYATALDIVRPSSTHSCCFTRGYGNYAVGTGSVLQHELNEEDMHRCFRVFEEKRTNGEVDLAVAALLPLKLRYFSPREVANLMRFPADFSIPPGVTLRQSYKVLGNSLNVHVVSLLLRYLLNDP